MSSLSSLKKDIESITEELSNEVFILVEKESQLADQQKKVKLLKDHQAKLQRALDILEDRAPTMQAEPISGTPVPPSPVPAAEPAPIPKPKYTGPLCPACQGKMYEAYTTVPSGITVKVLRCEDSSCNNEVY